MSCYLVVCRMKLTISYLHALALWKATLWRMKTVCTLGIKYCLVVLSFTRVTQEWWCTTSLRFECATLYRSHMVSGSYPVAYPISNWHWINQVLHAWMIMQAHSDGWWGAQCNKNKVLKNLENHQNAPGKQKRTRLLHFCFYTGLLYFDIVYIIFFHLHLWQIHSYAASSSS